jgi:hypothetical protein
MTLGAFSVALFVGLGSCALHAQTAPRVIPTPTADEPIPLSRLLLDAANNRTLAASGKALETFESMTLEGLKATGPAGAAAVVAYKVADLGRALGVAAVDREDRTIGAELVVISSDAALLKRLQIEGRSLNTDPQAIAAKERLTRIMLGRDIGTQGSLSYLGNVIVKNFDYAVEQVAIDKAIGFGVKRLFKIDRVSRFINEHVFPFGNEVRFALGNRSELRPLLTYFGWRKFGERADLAKKYVDKITSKVLARLVKDAFKQAIHSAADDALNRLADEVLRDHPSRLVVRQRIRLQVVRIEDLAPAAFALPVAAAALPMAQPVAAIPLESARDPVARTIYHEDSYIRPTRDSSPAQQQAEPQRAPPPEPPRPSKFHHELMCQGAGNKAGCNSNWDGNRGGTLHSR